MRRLLLFVMLVIVGQSAMAQGNRHRMVPITTDTPMVHDPVMAYEDSVYHLYCTGIGIQHMTSKDCHTWTVDPTPVMTVMPKWTHDSVPGFQHHVWAPDIIRWHGRWWLAYSCSTFGKNGSAIGLLSTPSLSAPVWNDEGCIVTSREGRDNWNAIDPCFVIDDNDQPWLTWGSFWDGIQMAPLDTTMHLKHHASDIRHQKPSLVVMPPAPRMCLPIRRRSMQAPTPSRHPSSSSMEAGTTSLYRGTTAVVVLRATTVLLWVAQRPSMVPISTAMALICARVAVRSS